MPITLRLILSYITERQILVRIIARTLTQKSASNNLVKPNSQLHELMPCSDLEAPIFLPPPTSASSPRRGKWWLVTCSTSFYHIDRQRFTTPINCFVVFTTIKQQYIKEYLWITDEISVRAEDLRIINRCHKNLCWSCILDELYESNNR